MIVNLEIYHAEAIRYQEQFEVQGKSLYYLDHTLIYKNIRIAIESLNREETIFHILSCYILDYRAKNKSSILITDIVEFYIDAYVHSKIQSYGLESGCLPR